LSTITDLFSISIGFGRKAVFIERLENTTLILVSDEKLPLKEKARFNVYSGEDLEEVLEKEGVVKENVYYVLPPSLYYRNTLSFPFSERQKIEGIIKYEVQDLLPVAEMDYVTDFYPNWHPPSGHEVYSFSAPKSEIRNILSSLGRYSENLKALIPFDVCILHGVTAGIDKLTFVFIDILDNAIFLQYVHELMMKSVVYIKYFDNDQYRSSLVSQLLMLLKKSGYPPVYVNTRSTAAEEFLVLNNGVFEELQLSYRQFPLQNFRDSFGNNHAVQYSDVVTLLGTLEGINKPPQKRVNLLKEEFKPRLKGYIRLKDFVTVGIILLALLIVSVSNLLIDMGFKKKQVRELREAVGTLSAKVFEKPQMRTGEAKKSLEDIQKKIGIIEKSIDRRYSSVELLRELSTFLPEDIVLEYTDLIIEADHIKFAGRTRTFSDIDRIKETLLLSEYISEVKVTNTGTTGSTEGFGVTFLFDIDIVQE
jgi:hypothetical protein